MSLWIDVVPLLLTAGVLSSAFPYDAPRQEPDEIVRPGPGVTLPKMKHKVEPQYTRPALDAGAQGNVLLQIEFFPALL